MEGQADDEITDDHPLKVVKYWYSIFIRIVRFLLLKLTLTCASPSGQNSESSKIICPVKSTRHILYTTGWWVFWVRVKLASHLQLILLQHSRGFWSSGFRQHSVIKFKNEYLERLCRVYDIYFFVRTRS